MIHILSEFVCNGRIESVMMPKSEAETEGTENRSKARDGGGGEVVGPKDISMSVPSKESITRGLVRDKGVKGWERGRGKESERERI